MNQPTPYPQVNAFLKDAQATLRATLGDKLVGLYLYGSLMTGGFDDIASDVDLLVATASDLTPAEVEALDRTHTALTTRWPERKDRLEIAYVSLHALRTFKTERSNIGIISPGEPFHVIDAGIDWLMNWYIVLAHGLTLYGPPPADIIEPTSQAEFVDAVKAHMTAYRGYIQHITDLPGQAYSILTMCRGLYTTRHGKHTSKKEAAAWAQNQMPEHADLIANALKWRQNWRDKNVDAAASLPETRRFVNLVIDRIEAGT